MTTDIQLLWQELKSREVLERPDVFAAYASFLAAVQRGEHPRVERPLIRVEGPADVPDFASEDEEAEYWAMHELGDAFYTESALPADVVDALSRIRARRSIGAR